MSISFDKKKVNRDLRLISPWLASRLENAVGMANKAGYEIDVFEGWRSPQRQAWLYEQGRSREGKIITKTKAWRSWHQYGLAVDIAFKDSKGWTWEGAFDKVKMHFEGLYIDRPYEWDQGHYQMSGDFSLMEAKAVYDQWGIQALWWEVEQRTRAKKTPGAV